MYGLSTRVHTGHKGALAWGRVHQRGPQGGAVIIWIDQYGPNLRTPIARQRHFLFGGQACHLWAAKSSYPNSQSALILVQSNFRSGVDVRLLSKVAPLD